MSENINNIKYIRERMDMVVDRVAEVNTSVIGVKMVIDGHVAKEEGLEKDLTRLTDILHKNTNSLQEHIRRTNLLEDYMKTVDHRLTPLEEERLRKRTVNSWLIIKFKLIAKIGAAV